MKEIDYFHSLENDLEQTFNFIEPDSNNFNCYGAKYASLLISTCVEFESVCKTLIKVNDSEAKVGDIGDIKGGLLKFYPKIFKNEVEVMRLNRKICPLLSWPSGKLDWWDAYNQLKHSRINNYHLANMKNTIEAMCGLLTVIVYLAAYRDNNKSLKSGNIFWMTAMQATLISSGGDLPDEETE